MGFFKKFGSHYAIERFGVLFLSLVICMGILVGSILTRKLQYDHRSLSGRVIYTTSFMMSETRTSGAVRGIYTNRDHTKAFLLLSFSDMSLLPMDANEYTMYLSGVDIHGNYEVIESSPSGIIYLFSESGQMGIYLQDVNGFPSQLLKLYLHADLNLANPMASKDTYNEGIIYFNPGGAYATYANFLERDNWTVFDLVEELMTRKEEASLRTSLRNDLANMQQQQLLTAEYTKRLTDYGIIVPGTPNEIDDEIYALASDGSTRERLHYISEYGGGWVDASGAKGFRNNEVTLYLDSESVVSGGFDFNWQDSRILNGYLEDITGSSDVSDWNAYVNSRSGGSAKDELDLSHLVWMLNDGTVIDENATGLSRANEIRISIQGLKNVWSDYYATKRRYEAEHLASLLRLEIRARTMFSYYTTNTGESGKTLILMK